jgi:hypothetical protein
VVNWYLHSHFRLLVLVEAGSLHMDHAQRPGVLDLRSLAGCMVEWVAGLHARCFDCYGPRSQAVGLGEVRRFVGYFHDSSRLKHVEEMESNRLDSCSGVHNSSQEVTQQPLPHSLNQVC